MHLAASSESPRHGRDDEQQRFTRPPGAWVDPPAWRIATAFARRPPAFLVIGAQRAATTSLYRLLTSHTGVLPALRKEVHYFDFQHAKGPQWYLAHFPLRTVSGLTGEASPYYMVHPLAPERVKRMNPRMLLIAILRDPVDRALSHYHREVRLGCEPLTFEEAVDAEPERLANDQHRLLEPPHYYSHNHHHYSYLDRGRYGHHLGRWLEHFPRQQLHVVRMESLFEDPETVIGRTLAFLGLQPLEGERLNLPHDNRAPTYPAQSPTLRARLARHFEADQARLERLLGNL